MSVRHRKYIADLNRFKNSPSKQRLHTNYVWKRCGFIHLTYYIPLLPLALPPPVALLDLRLPSWNCRDEKALFRIVISSWNSIDGVTFGPCTSISPLVPYRPFFRRLISNSHRLSFNWYDSLVAVLFRIHFKWDISHLRHNWVLLCSAGIIVLQLATSWKLFHISASNLCTT